VQKQEAESQALESSQALRIRLEAFGAGGWQGWSWKNTDPNDQWGHNLSLSHQCLPTSQMLRGHDRATPKVLLQRLYKPQTDSIF